MTAWWWWMGWALGQQPLDVFLGAASEHASDAQVAEAELRRARAGRTQAVGALLPQLSAQAGYTRNQQAIEATFPGTGGELETITITALDQLDASARVDLPLLDVPAWSQGAAAAADVRGAEARRSLAGRGVDIAVATAWYRLVAARSVAAAAAQALETAEASRATVTSRADAGLASEVDRARAAAEVARAAEALASASLEEALAARQLEALSGVAPGPKPVELPRADGEEAPLDAWLARVERADEVVAAEATVDARGAGRTAAGGRLVPTVDAFAQERWTNASGFGPQALWSAGVTASWRLDVAGSAGVSAAAADLAVARARAEAARRDIETAITETWHRVRSQSARLDAAEASETASTRAATVARERFAAGAGSQLELSIAERDRFDAEVARLRALADLHLQRRVLRLLVGLPPDLAASP